jgi:Protein of unknown function (DUF3311)
MPPLYKSVRYALKEMTAAPNTTGPVLSMPSAVRRYNRGWLLLLALPYLGLCFPGLYMRATPTLMGFPFFYWYQFAWVVTTSCLLWVVYLKIRQAE